MIQNCPWETSFDELLLMPGITQKSSCLNSDHPKRSCYLLLLPTHFSDKATHINSPLRGSKKERRRNHSFNGSSPKAFNRPGADQSQEFRILPQSPMMVITQTQYLSDQLPIPDEQEAVSKAEPELESKDFDGVQVLACSCYRNAHPPNAIKFSISFL